jgi:hypothetical protein
MRVWSDLVDRREQAKKNYKLLKKRYKADT